MLLVMAVLSVTSASAAGKTQILTQRKDDVFVSRPATLSYVSQPFVVGMTYGATRLHWRHWGKSRATANGKLRICPNMAPCIHYHAKVVASGLVRHAEGTSDNVYAYVSFRRSDKKKVLMKLCVYAEACALGPAP